MRFAKRNPSRSPRVRRPAAEPLERRVLMALNSWAAAVNGNWDVASNWSLGHVPLASEDVDITVAGSYTVTISGGSYVANTVQLGSSGNQTPTLELNLGNLAVSSGFTNLGAITFDNTDTTQGLDSTLTVASGTLTNAAGATITAEGVAGQSKADVVAAALANAGAVDVTAPKGLTVNGPVTNTGTVDVAAGGLTVYGTGTSTNTGAITVASGVTVAFADNGTVDLNGGSIGGAGSTLSVNGTLNLGIDLTDATTALTLNLATVNGPGTLTNAAGQMLTLDGGTINAPLVNQGTFEVTGNIETVGGPITTAVGSAIVLNLGNLAASSGFTNLGSITFDNTDTTQGLDSTLTVASGTLTNAAGATITAEGVAGQSKADQISGALANAGTVDVTAPKGLTVNGTVTNTGTVDVAAGGLTVNGTGTSTNTGTVTVASGVTVAFAGNSTIDLNGGSIGGVGATLSVNGTLNLGIDLTDATTALDLSLATVNGPGTLTNAAGQTLTLQADTIDAPLLNQGTIDAVRGYADTIGGSFTTTAGSALDVNLAELTVSSGFTNLGSITLDNTDTTENVDSSLSVTSGVLTNAAGATITAQGLTGQLDADVIAAPLNNAGTVTVTAPKGLTVNGPVTNTGTVNVPAGVTATFNGEFSQSGGTLGSGGTVALDGGFAASLGGPTVQVDGTLAAASTLTLSVAAGITVSAGKTYPVLEYTSLVGSFSSVDTSALTGLAVTPTAGATEYDVAVTSGSLTGTAGLAVTAAADQPATAGAATTFNLGTLATTGATAPYTVTVDWGDGSADTTFTMAAAGTIAPQSHTYAVAATDTVSVTATDAVGDASNVATFSVAVAAAAATAAATVHVYDDPGQTGSTATPLAGRTVFVDANGNGVLDAGEQLAVTGADGSATLTVPVGQASEIGEVLPVNVGQSQPSTADAAVAGDAAGDTVNFFTKALSATAATTGAFYSDYSLSSLPAGFETDDVVTQPDGKLLVAGTDRAGTTPTAFVARFFADGEADLNFGVDGIADGPANSVAANVVEEPDGTVYLASNGAGSAAGTATVTGFTAAGAASTVAAYTTPAADAATAAGLTLMADGSLLLSGTVHATSAAVTTGTAFLTDLAEATLGPVATFGTAGTALGTATGVSLIGLAQVGPTGTLDVFAEPLAGSGLALDSYSAAGVLASATPLAAALGTGFTPASAAVQADGQLIVAGLGPSASGTDDTVTVARVNADGTADTTFGTAGLVSEDESSLVSAAGTLAISDAEVLPDGTVLVTGKYDDPATATYQCFCEEYTSAGAVELGYGQTNSLVVTTDTAAGVAALATATGVLPVATETAAAAAGEAVPVALIDGSVGFPLPVMLTARAVADLVVESAPPTAALQPLLVNPVTAATAAAAEQLVVEYADPIAVDLQTVASGNLRVTGPGGTTLSATFAGFEPTGDAQAAFATYTVAPAGGAWTAADNGSYAVALLANQVRNTAVYAAADATLGTFTVDVGGTAGAAATTVTVTPGAASAKTGNLLAFTVTVASATAGPAPTGTVTFADGAGLLGTATLAGGTATFATAALPAGSADVVTATYSGDGTYAAGTSSTATVAVAGPAAGAAALTPSLPHAILPAAVVAGSKLKLSLPLAITDGGGAAEKGTVTVNLYASTDATLDGGDTLVATIARAVSIKAGRATTVKLALTSLPASLAEGTYHLLAQVVDAAGFAQTAASGGTVTVAAPFTDPKLTVTRVTGPTTLSAGGKGHGSALLTLADGGNVPLSGSVTVTLYLTADGAVDAAAPVVRTVVERVDIPAGKAKTVSVPLSTIPATLVAGRYQFAASVAAPAVDGAAAASATAVDPTAITVTA